MTDVPTMDEVLKDAPKNWGKWGEEDEVGALNYLTTEEVFRGVRHIKSGTVFTLQRLIGDPKGDPVWPGRTPAEKTMILDESSGRPQRRGPPVHLLYTAAPLKVNQASGSPVNPLVIK